MQQNLALSSIVRDPSLQTRERLDEEWIAELSDLYRGNHEIAAIEVVFDGARYLLTDGWHRIEAQFRAWGADAVIAVEIIDASTTDDPLSIAKTRAAMGNREGGLRRTDGDKRKAVILLRSTPAGRKMTHDEISKRVGVSRPWVTRLLSEAEGDVRTNIDSGNNVPRQSSVAALHAQVDAALRAAPDKANSQHATELKCHRQVIAARRTALGLPRSGLAQRNDPARREAMVEDLRQNPEHGTVALANKHGVSARAVAKARDELGLPPKPPGPPRGSPPSAPVNPKRSDDPREQGQEILPSRPPPSRRSDAVTDFMQRFEVAERLDQQTIATALYNRWPHYFRNAFEEAREETASVMR